MLLLLAKAKATGGKSAPGGGNIWGGCICQIRSYYRVATVGRRG